MALIPGTRIGVYEVTAQIGEGGMGQVFRATDTKLKRQVAIKILPPSLSADRDQLARFQREAEVLASLNHPNIAAIHGIEESGSGTALVMELVEGEDLSHRIARGAIPVAEALTIATQIAEALEAAHEQGIVHRDLKPANIKVRADGTVKVLDFGLAKEMVPAGASSMQQMNSPTLSIHATLAGIILGTAAYMSPEQARGRGVDARTDIWAFGCVLFEMLTARRPFDGETVTDILGAIVHKEPEWDLLPPTLPASLRRTLERCLAKDQKQRLRSIADVRLEIQDLLTRPRSGAHHVDAAPAPPRDVGLTRREAVAWALAAASLVAALSAIALLWMRPRGSELPALRLSLLHPEGSEVGIPAISPDGRRVAYSARRTDGMPMVWVRDLDQSTPKAIAGTESGKGLFWSPDSKRLGFFVGGILKQVSADGGPVQEIVRGVRVGAAWGAGDVLVYAAANANLFRVRASGGETSPATSSQGPDWEYTWPSMLPDGRHFLFTAKHWAGLAESGAQGIYVGSLDDPADVHQLLPELSAAVYAPPGYVVFARAGQLMAATFDAAARRITGEPIGLGEAVAFDTSFFTAGVSAAANGTLAIRPPPAPVASAASGQAGAFEAELTLVRRDGSVIARFGGVQELSYHMAMSPDGRTVVAQVQDTRSAGSDLWRFDVETGARTALTSMRTTGGYVGSPVWSPDGTRIAFACQPPKILDDVCVRDMRTGTVTKAIDSPAIWEHPTAWSADGQYMLVAYNDYTKASIEELRVWSSRTGTVSPYIKPAQRGIFSPDTTFVAFNSLETGRAEVYVTTFPERRQTWPVTTEGGRVLSWSADGHELLVATLTGHIAAYPVTTSNGSFSAGAPQVLVRNVGFDGQYTLANHDHSRILIRVAKDADKDRGEIRLLFGWANGLAARSGVR